MFTFVHPCQPFEPHHPDITQDAQRDEALRDSRLSYSVQLLANEGGGRRIEDVGQERARRLGGRRLERVDGKGRGVEGVDEHTRADG